LLDNDFEFEYNVIVLIDRRSVLGGKMKTITKGETRRKEILLAARELFVRKGYEQTSVNDILNIVGIAKGTFYFYFTSKEEVLEAIILDIVEEGAIRAEKIVKDKSIPIVNRIMMAIMAQAPEFEGSEEISKEMHKVENAKLEQLYLSNLLKRMTPVLQEAVTEGIEKGIFHMKFPTECTETLLLLGHMLFDSNVFEWKMEEFPVKIKAFLENAERMLGTKEGELSVFLQMFGNQI
jgi:AcrR family transcriptional regulator